MITYTATPSDIEKKWWLIDAQDLVLGRLAVEVADLLRGKHKTPTPRIWIAAIMSSSSMPGRCI